jgi:hypothetical protein
VVIRNGACFVMHAPRCELLPAALRLTLGLLRDDSALFAGRIPATAAHARHNCTSQYAGILRGSPGLLRGTGSCEIKGFRSYPLNSCGPSLIESSSSLQIALPATVQVDEP